MVDKEFSQILAEYLKSNEISQGKFATIIGVKQPQVSEWISGRTKPGYDMLKRMAIACGISADYFLGITDY